MVRLIGKELIEIYIEKAEELVKIDLAYALKAFESGLVVAQRAGERESEARISHKIGELYYLEGQFERSVEYQEQYLSRLKQSIEDELLREAEDGIEKKDNQNSLKFKEMEAHASLAKCYLKLKNIEQSELHLNEYHRMAKEAKAQNSVADSSYYLAKLFEEKGEKEKAIVYYQSYFEAAKSEKPDKKDRKLVDKARVTYAIAKAAKNMDKYIGLFEGDNSLRNVLDWKIKRVLK
jgi:tetratricopeptide (TPR) repeat protein